MSVVSLSVSRLEAIKRAWQSLGSAGDAVAARCDALVCVIGNITPNTLENQRGQAVLQYLFDVPPPVSNLAVIVAAGEMLVLHDGGVSVAEVTMEAYKVSTMALTAESKVAIERLLVDKVVGAALKEFEIQEGPFATGVIAAVKEASHVAELVEAAPLLGSLLFRKDEAAVGAVEKAAGMCTAIFRRYCREMIEREMGKSNPRALHELREQLCEKLQNPNAVHGLEALNATEFSLAAGLTTCIFSDGAYIPHIQVDHRQLLEATQGSLTGGVITIRYGAKNNGHTAFFARTLIVESKAPTRAKDVYSFVHSVSDKVIDLLTPGTTLQEVYAQAVAFATSLDPQMAACLPKSLGFSTGLLVLEARGTLSDKGTAIVDDGMCFVVRVFLERVPEGSEYPVGVELADTVVIRGGVAELKTKVARRLEDIVYEEDRSVTAFEPQGRDLAKITRQGQSETVLLSREAQREEELKGLLRELHAEFIAAGGRKAAAASSEELRVYHIGRLAYGELPVLTGGDHVPQDGDSKGIRIQSDKRVAWFPICGVFCPFHIGTISRADVKAEGALFTMIVTFHTLQEAYVGFKLNRTRVFLKELTYTCRKDIFTDVQTLIHGLQQRIKNDDAERKRQVTSAAFSKLLLIPNALRLPQIKIRPPVAVGRQNKGSVGNLELHQNGLRFSFLGGTPIDLHFDNIKHVIFQPAVHTICVVYHVTLKKSVEVGRKSVTEIQFVAEVLESSEATTAARRSFDEEVYAEERDEERVKETNKQFITFARAVEEKSKIRTQLPTSKFSFDGVHTRSMTTFKGSREALWAVSDWPAFTQSVDEIEVVSFERVIPGGATFDMTLILKDYTKPVVCITAIPRPQLEVIKDWCLAARLYYMETTVNPNWKVTLKDIREDPEWDPWQPGAGWAVLNNDDDEDDEEGGEDSDSDSTYYEESEEDSDTDGSSFMEDEESDVPSGSEEDESSDADWEEHDRKAEEFDRKRRYADDDDDEKPRKRHRPAVPQHSAPASNPPLGRTTKAPLPLGRSAVPPPRRF